MCIIVIFFVINILKDTSYMINANIAKIFYLICEYTIVYVPIEIIISDQICSSHFKNVVLFIIIFYGEISIFCLGVKFT